jgi:hypothetical protein
LWIDFTNGWGPSVGDDPLARDPAKWNRLAGKITRQVNMSSMILSAKIVPIFADHALEHKNCIMLDHETGQFAGRVAKL